MAKIGRNDPCPCESGRKYKYCCLNAPASPFQLGRQNRQPVRQTSLLPAERLIFDGETASIEGNAIEACRKWLEVWEVVKSHIDGTVRSIRELDDALNWAPNLYNWCQDLELELGNAAVQDNEYHEKRIRYCEEFVERLPDSDDLIIENMMRAEGEAYFMLGKPAEGEAVYERLTEKYPRSPWAYIGWGDAYVIGVRSGWNIEQAEKRYRHALTLATEKLDRAAIEQRLQELQGNQASDRKK